MSSELLSRRELFQRTGTSALALVLANMGGNVVMADDEKQPKTLAEVFKDIPLTDQLGKEFKPAELFKDTQCLVLFGYGGCPLCQEISNTVAAVQQELIRQGKTVPIVVVSVQPEKDKDGMKAYVGSYYVKGVRQFQEELLPKDEEKRRAIGEKSFDDAKDKPQLGRILHVVCPPSAKDAQEAERRIGLIFNQNDPKSHSSFLTLFDKGVAAKSYRGLPPHKEPEPEKYAGNIAKAVAADINQPSHAKSP